MADTPFTTFQFPATGGSTSRTMPDRLDDVINVKEFGAVGDGVADDRIPVQNALDRAFGSVDNPHGSKAYGGALGGPLHDNFTDVGPYKNRAVFFPRGRYNCVPPPKANITAVTRADGARATASITGTTLTVSALTFGTIAAGQTIYGTAVVPGTLIVSGSGSTWTVNINYDGLSGRPAPVASTKMNFIVPTSINGSISGTTLTVNSVTAGTVSIGMEIFGANVASGTVITSGSGTTWTVFPLQDEPISSITMDLSANIVVTVDSTANYLSGHICEFRAIASVPQINEMDRGIVKLNSTQISLVRTNSATIYGLDNYSGSGGTVWRAALAVRNLHGAYIYGAGRGVSSLQSFTANSTLFCVNGAQYCVFERFDLSVQAGTMNGGSCFDFNWDGTGTTALQSCSFRDMFFYRGDYGLRIAYHGQMGSEGTVINCFFLSNTVGLWAISGNALQWQVIGGNFTDNAVASIKTTQASVPFIAGVGFQNQNNVGGYDIDLSPAGVSDTCFIVGCRSESVNFVNTINGGTQVHIDSCSGANGGAGGNQNGDFLRFIGFATVTNCQSDHGLIRCAANSGHLSGTNNYFTRSGFWDTGAANIADAITAGFDAGRLLTNSSGDKVLATFATLPTANLASVGGHTIVNDSTTKDIGAAITGGGSFMVMAIVARNGGSPRWEVMYNLDTGTTASAGVK